MSGLTPEEIKSIWRRENEEDTPEFDLEAFRKLNDARQAERRPTIRLGGKSIGWEIAHADDGCYTWALRILDGADGSAPNVRALLAWRKGQSSHMETAGNA